MKTDTRMLLSFLMICLLPVAGLSQSWFLQIPDDGNGRLNYSDARAYVNAYRQSNPTGPLAGEKQFLRAQFFLEGRILDDGYLPDGLYWEEAKRVIAGRSNNRAVQPSWNFIGPDHSTLQLNSGIVGGSGRIDCITSHPADPQTFYVGGPSGGLWRTTDGGESWEPLTDNLPTWGSATSTCTRLILISSISVQEPAMCGGRPFRWGS